MKSFTEEITIAKPRHEVIEIIQSIEHYPEWQPELKDYQTFKGMPLEEGAKTRLVYSEGRHENVKLVETVVENNLPDNLKFRHSTEGVLSYHNHIFIDNGDSTLYKMECEYDFDGLMQVLSIFTPNHFKKQVIKFMESLKNYAERH